MCEFGTLRGLIKYYVKSLQETKRQLEEAKDGLTDRDDGDWNSSDPDGASVVGEQ